MNGSHEIIVKNNRVQYRFTISRNLTMLRGNSATGKSTLVDMVAQYARDGENSGITLACDKVCAVLTPDAWQIRLAQMRDSIIFLDEDCAFVTSVEFARMARESDNYYVIVIRESLPMLPYSVDEIYTLQNRTKGYGRIKRMYTQTQRMYARSDLHGTLARPDLVIVEDSNAGYQFFLHYYEQRGISCRAAGGKSRIAAVLATVPVDAAILVIADGAAFGPEIEKVLAQRHSHPRLMLYLPESFEWMILQSSLLGDKEVREIMRHPEDYIDCQIYFSWEQYFTSLLVESTQESYLHYNKSQLNPVYLQPHEQQAIMISVPEEIAP